MQVDQDTAYTEELYAIGDRTTLIFTKPWSDVKEADREMLTKMLKAARTSLEAVRIIHQPKLDLAALSPQPARMIYFGEPVSGLGQYECIKTQGTIVLAPALHELQNDADGKKKLWVALKQLFGL